VCGIYIFLFTACQLFQVKTNAWVITLRSIDTLQSMNSGHTSEFSEKRLDLLNMRTDLVKRDEDERNTAG